VSFLIIRIATVSAALPLGTWSVPGLEHFSGSMTYEKTVEIPATLLKERVLLDCGKVGVAAEVWVNDVYAGARPWQPFVLEVTEHLRPGPNRFKIRVANMKPTRGRSAKILIFLRRSIRTAGLGQRRWCLSLRGKFAARTR
jgi:Glycosyl hydrolases family 2, sugar binding domain